MRVADLDKFVTLMTAYDLSTHLPSFSLCILYFYWIIAKNFCFFLAYLVVQYYQEIAALLFSALVYFLYMKINFALMITEYKIICYYYTITIKGVYDEYR